MEIECPICKDKLPVAWHDGIKEGLPVKMAYGACLQDGLTVEVVKWN